MKALVQQELRVEREKLRELNAKKEAIMIEIGATMKRIVSLDEFGDF